MRDGRVDALGSGCGVQNTVTIDTHRHGQSLGEVQDALFKGQSLPLRERKTRHGLHF